MGASTVRILGMIDEVYYTPQIVASRLGFFRDEGLDVEFTVGDIADLPRSVATGDADFALCGLWQPWLYAERLDAPVVAFAELNQQVPLMLFGRVPADEFDWSSLNGGTFQHTSVMAASPWCALQELFRLKGVDLGAVNLFLGSQPAEARELFKAGSGDIVELFGLGATPLRRRSLPMRALICSFAGVRISAPFPGASTTPPARGCMIVASRRSA